jgi:hypothetical protein
MEMRHKKVVWSTLLMVAGFLTLQAQEVIVAAGGESTGSSGLVSYTIGQVFYSTITDELGSIAEGVQQPFEISVETGIDKPGINLNISAYPNPATDYLHLEVDASASINFQSMSYQIFDLNGRLIASETIVNDVTTIVTSALSPATYFVKVLGDNEEVKTFKVIKY